MWGDAWYLTQETISSYRTNRGLVSNSANQANFGLADDYVPKNGDDLYKSYAPFVTRLVTRYNRVSANFDDLLQHVWLEILRVDLITKYNSSTGSIPKVLTTDQTCSYLGMTWDGFKYMQIRGMNGDPRSKSSGYFRQASSSLKEEVLLRDGPNCHCCGSSTKRLQWDLDDHWLYSDRTKYANKMAEMWLPKNHRVFCYVGLDETVPVKKGNTFKVRYKVFCPSCVVKMFGGVPEELETIVNSDRLCLTPASGTYGSRKATYFTTDVERLKSDRGSNPKCKSNPNVPPLKLQPKPYFKLYLARSVHNIYANWCRTRDRKYKEHFPGVDPDTGKSWEETLVDSYGPRQETMYALHEALGFFFNGKEDLIAAKHEEVLSLVAKGLTPEEIVNRMRLPKRVLKALAHLN
jgi:hypothetical protein